MILERGFIKYLINQTEFLREEIKAKIKIIDHLLKLQSRDEQNLSYKSVQNNKSSNEVELFSTTIAHRDLEIVMKIVMI